MVRSRLVAAIGSRGKSVLVALSVAFGALLAAGAHLTVVAPDDRAARDAHALATTRAGSGGGLPQMTAGPPATTEPSAGSAPTSGQTPASPPPGTSTQPPTTTPSTGTPAPTTTTSASRKAPRSGAHADQVLDLVNAERNNAGCAPVASDARLTAAAQGHSDDMSEQNYFSHTSKDGRTFADRIRDAGYPDPGAENIAKGQRSAEEVMKSWMASSGHRGNILDCSLTALGTGVATGGWYWTQNFGR